MDLQNHQTSQKLAERFEFRSILPEETDQAVTIEHICFPPNEACSRKAMTERIAAAPELFLVAIDRTTGREFLVLTCLEPKVQMYQKMGFLDLGIANSTWGGEEWHEMTFKI